VRNLERGRVSRSVAMKLTGHKTEEVYRRYAIVSESDLQEGVRKAAAVRSRHNLRHSDAPELRKNGVDDGVRTRDHWSHSPPPSVVMGRNHTPSARLSVRRGRIVLRETAPRATVALTLEHNSGTGLLAGSGERQKAKPP
jgi:hypothetical protein